MNRPFRKKFDTPRLSPAEAERQGRAPPLAFQAPGNAAAVAFLNTENPVLGGRPIDLAIAGPEGLAAVEAEIVALSAASPA